MKTYPKLKILLVALHYGKEGSGGARRSFLWAKGLRENGHSVSVVSPYVETDHPDDIYIPHPIRSRREPVSENTIKPGFVERHIKNPIRIWARWPDAEITWHQIVLKTILSIDESYDWVITTSPPESAHRVGYKIAQTVSAKWCVEFRDSWVENSHRPYVKGLRKALERQLAKYWLKHADAVTAVDEETLKEVKSLTSNTPSSQIGHFSEPFNDKAKILSSETFNLVHAGGFSLSDRRRKLHPLLASLDLTFKMRPDLHLHLLGPLSPDEIKSLYIYKDQITNHGWVTLAESRAIQAGSDAVLLYTPKEGSTALPGKYSEYCCLRKPIFFLGSEHIRKKAPRHDEFFEIADLQDFPKNIEMAEETENTVSNATKRLESLLTSASKCG